MAFTIGFTFQDTTSVALSRTILEGVSLPRGIIATIGLFKLFAISISSFIHLLYVEYFHAKIITILQGIIFLFNACLNNVSVGALCIGSEFGTE